MKRSKFTLYRPGSAAVEMIPGFLLVYERGVAPLTGLEVPRITSGFIDFRRNADLKLGDFLKDTLTSRIFQVAQIADYPAARRALIAEITPPIPDNFDNAFNGSVETFWTLVQPDASDFGSVGSTQVMSLTGGPSAITPAFGAYASQPVNGNFDVWSKVGVVGGSALAIRYALIGVRTSTGEGVCVGLKNDGTPNFVRVEFFDLNDTLETLATGVAFSKAAALNGYVRIARRGTVFHTYYSLSVNEPVTEQEWIELFPADVVYNNEAVDVGMFGYCESSTLGTLSWEFFRNWPISV